MEVIRFGSVELAEELVMRSIPVNTQPRDPLVQLIRPVQVSDGVPV
jgi:hypothetical protein